MTDEDLIALGRRWPGAVPPWGIGSTREDYLQAVRAVLAAAATLPNNALLRASLRLNHNGQYATCETTGDPWPAIQRLIEECEK